ncbi:hypothetical protein CEQ90_10730 [Lewinellaceae bacterium SD302]|nr:hypothetical protein CEQ90_10730 [Lewinellaceae bacterium SD302]
MGLSKSTQHKLFKAGHYIKGVIYLLIGGFALATVVGAARGTGGPKAVIDWIGNNPFGQLLLVLLALGLFSYCAWRWYKAVADTENEGHDKEGTVKRVAWAVSGTAYGFLGIYAVNLIVSGGGSKGGKKDVIAQLLEESWGVYAVGLIGLIMAGVGIYQFYRGVSEKYMEDINSGSWSDDKQDVYRTSGKVGHVARSVVYGIIAYFLFRAAMMEDASQFKGIGESLSYLRDGSFGTALLALVGMGLFAYGFFMFIKARYKAI